MDSGFMPKIKVEVDMMKAGIINALGVRGSDVEGYINAAIDREVKKINYEAIVHQHVSVAINSAIEQHFSFSGKGGKAIRKAVVESLTIQQKG